MPPVKLGARPFITLSRVDLPEPVGPQTKMNFPAATSKFTLFRVGLSVAGEPSGLTKLKVRSRSESI